MRSFPSSDPPAGGPEKSTSRRRRLPTISGVHLLIITTGLLAFLGNLALLRGGEAAHRQMAVSRHDLTPGRRLQLDDIRLAPVDVEESIASGLLSDSELDGYQGWVIARQVAAGSLLNKTDLRSPLAQSTSRAMSFPIEADHAVGGDLMAGDRVDVIRVDEDQARFVATNLEVLGVPGRSDGGLGLSGGYYLVTAVNERTALALALALAHGQVEVVRSTGSGPVTVTSLKEYQPDPEVLSRSSEEADDQDQFRSTVRGVYPPSREETLP